MAAGAVGTDLALRTARIAVDGSTDEIINTVGESAARYASCGNAARFFRL